MIPVSQFGSLVVGDSVGLALRCGQADGDMDGHFGQSQFEGSFITGIADNNDSFLVHDEGLTKAEGVDRGGHGLDGMVVVSWVMRIGLDVGDAS